MNYEIRDLVVSSDFAPRWPFYGEVVGDINLKFAGVWYEEKELVEMQFDTSDSVSITLQEEILDAITSMIDDIKGLEDGF